MTRAIRLPSGLKLMNLLLGSWTALVFAFLYIPIVLLVLYSFNAAEYGIEWTGWTLDWYRKMAQDGGLIDALKTSLLIAAITTAISVILGTTGAWLLYRFRYPMRRAIEMLIFIPMAIPEIIMGIGLLILFQTGIGWVENFQAVSWAPQWFAGMEFERGITTVVISHVTFCFPFVLVAVQARLAGVDPALEEAAMDLGATPLRAFWSVMVPYLMPAIVSGALMAFTLSMDEIVITYFTSGPDSQTLPMKIFGKVKKGLDPSLNAISAIFIFGTALLVLLAEWIKRLGRDAHAVKP